MGFGIGRRSLGGISPAALDMNARIRAHLLRERTGVAELLQTRSAA